MKDLFKVIALFLLAGWIGLFVAGTFFSWVYSVEYRLNTGESFSEWYASDSGCPSVLAKAVSGLCLVGDRTK